MLADELKSNPARDFDTVWFEESPVWIANARAAIEAMREPTSQMVAQTCIWTADPTDE